MGKMKNFTSPSRGPNIVANKSGMRPEHARYVKDQRGDAGRRHTLSLPSGDRSPDGSARLFDKRGDRWQTRKDSLSEFGVEFCPCCGQPVNPEMDQYTRATRAVLKRDMPSDKPLRPGSLCADDARKALNIALKLKAKLRKLGALE
jgi:hypothetical protein